MYFYRAATSAALTHLNSFIKASEPLCSLQSASSSLSRATSYQTGFGQLNPFLSSQKDLLQVPLIQYSHCRSLSVSLSLTPFPTISPQIAIYRDLLCYSLHLTVCHLYVVLGKSVTVSVKCGIFDRAQGACRSCSGAFHHYTLS